MLITLGIIAVLVFIAFSSVHGSQHQVDDQRSQSGAQHMPSEASRFQIVCKLCDGLGIVFDCTEGAPFNTVIKCRHCGAPRGTLGDLEATDGNWAPLQWNGGFGGKLIWIG